MRYRENLGVREYLGISAAALGFAGSLALTAACGSSATPNPSPLPTATASASPREGCVELTAAIESASPKTGTTFELGLVALWGTGMTVTGERFTFTRLQPDPNGPTSYSQTPVIPIDQGVLPSIFHTFPPATTPESFLVKGEVITGDGQIMTGPQCELKINIETIYESPGPQSPALAAAAQG